MEGRLAEEMRIIVRQKHALTEHELFEHELFLQEIRRCAKKGWVCTRAFKMSEKCADQLRSEGFEVFELSSRDSKGVCTSIVSWDMDDLRKIREKTGVKMNEYE